MSVVKEQRTKPILLLSGTPASGKDTISASLQELNSRFRHFKKHRGSEEPKDDATYVHVDIKKFNRLAEQGAFVQYHSRYGRGYGVALSELENHWELGELPIIHVGKYENIKPFIDAGLEVRSVLLMVDKMETKRRLKLRHPRDKEEIAKRLAAYQEERDELAELIRSGIKLAFNLILDNSGNDPQQIAEQIAMVYQS